MSAPFFRVFRALVATVLSVLAAELHSQAIILQTDSTEPAVEVLEAVLARRNFLLVDRDTILPESFHTAGDLIIWDARVRLEGSVEGAAVALRGTLFVRPGARIGGPIAALGGLVLPSHLAEVGAITELPPNHRVSVYREPAGLRIVVAQPPPVPRLGLGGLLGFRRIAYDRVDGLSVSWGPQWRIVGEEFGPRVDAWATFRTARSRPGGGVQFRTPLLGALDVAARAERGTVTNEHWIRSDLGNSLEALVLGRDVRDYFETEGFSMHVGRAAADPWSSVTAAVAPYVAVRHSSYRSLETRSPWALHGRRQLERPNLPVTEMSLLSAEAGADFDWAGAAARFQGNTFIEHGSPREAAEDFTRWLATGRWEMEALWNHSLSVSAHAFGTLSSSAAPPQRWSYVGGAGTLPTLPVAALRGDNLVFVASRYEVPLVFADLPVVGFPALELLHSTGTAWLTGSPMPSWEQNVGLGFAFSVARFRAWIDPTVQRPRPTLLFEFALP